MTIIEGCSSLCPLSDDLITPITLEISNDEVFFPTSVSFAEEVEWAYAMLSELDGATEACGTLQSFLSSAFPSLTLQSNKETITLSTETASGGQSTQNLTTGNYDGAFVIISSESNQDAFFSIPVSVYWVEPPSVEEEKVANGPADGETTIVSDRTC